MTAILLESYENGKVSRRQLVQILAACGWEGLDGSDSLVSPGYIDAVVVWENLLGTSDEVTFRVSAALAKLLERDGTRRRTLQKELSKVYRIRSRLIHGAAVDASMVEKVCSRAIEVAVQALRASYARGRE